jgi:hypothetical protein
MFSCSLGARLRVIGDVFHSSSFQQPHAHIHDQTLPDNIRNIRFTMDTD